MNSIQLFLAVSHDHSDPADSLRPHTGVLHFPALCAQSVFNTMLNSDDVQTNRAEMSIQDSPFKDEV